MDDVKLIRTEHDKQQGTFGIIVFGSQYLYTGELPWRQNKPNISRIPQGKYVVRVRNSPKYGQVYHITDVRGRSYILFHQGNFCGDRSLGFRTNVQGCILLGRRRGKLYGQKAVLSSRPARRAFELAMGMQPFNLEIINGYS